MPKRSGGREETHGCAESLVPSPSSLVGECGEPGDAAGPHVHVPNDVGAYCIRPQRPGSSSSSFPDPSELETSCSVIAIWQWGKDQLHTAGVAHPDLDAEMLLRQALGISRAAFFARLQDTVARDVRNQYYEYIEKRVHNLPVQYIIGKQEFMGLDFHVTPDVLIPRPETEGLVELVLAKLDTNSQSLVPSPWSLVELQGLSTRRGAAMQRPFGRGGEGTCGRSMATPLQEDECLGTRDSGLGTHPISALRIADIGCGSGAIALSLAHYLPDCHVFAVDISPAALTVARENAMHLGVSERVTFLQGDLLAPLGELGLYSALDAIVSNPPYIPRAVIPTLDAHVQAEPHLALDGGVDGLDYYRRIAAGAGEYLVPGGLLAVEVGHDQAEQVATLFQDNGYENVEIHKDLAGIERMVIGTRCH